MDVSSSAPPAVRGPQGLQRRSGAERRQARVAFWFLLPWAIGFLAFVIWPILDSLYLSFTNYNILSRPHWIGFGNYTYMLFGSGSLFWNSVLVTLYYVMVSVPLGTVIALALAVLLNQKVVGEGLFRTLFYIPSVISGVAVAVLWFWVFQPQFGLLNSLLYSVFHVANGPQWLQGTGTAMPSLILMSLWSLGTPMLVYLAGLQGIQYEMYEAAKVDGARSWRMFRHITLPMLTPQILFNVILGLIAAFQLFINPYIMTQGGPGYATTTMVLYLYKSAFQDFQMGYASALAWAILVFTLAFTAFVFRSFTNRVFYGGE